MLRGGSVKRFAKIISLLLVGILVMGSTYVTGYAYGTGDYVIYNVVSGDSLWKVSTKFNVTIQSIRDFNSLSSDMLYINQKLEIPVTSIDNLPRPIDLVHTVVSGDTLWKLSVSYKASLSSIMQKNGFTENSILYVGQKIIIPLTAASENTQSTQPYVTYTDYYVKSGDTIWSIAEKFGIPMSELLKVNGLNESSWLSLNQKIIIPVHHVPVTPTKGAQYGEYLDWWTQAQYVLTIGKTAKITDFYTGKSWYIKRTIGANHADVETLTAQDTVVMKSVWGGSWSWASRPVIVEVDGRKIAAAMSGMPHAGVDGDPAMQTVNNRSGGYGTGPNLDFIKGNEMDGHVDLHFLNSTTHNTGQVSTSMQNSIKIAAGIQ